MTLDQLKRRQVELRDRDRELAGQIGAKEALIETSIKHLKEIFGDDEVPDDPEKIDYDKLAKMVEEDIATTEKEIEALITEAEAKLDKGEEELARLVGAN